MSYVDGNIVRIHMKDFLTFDNMEVQPKPHLNVIIGPNGTGKSTILCGLALALSAKPGITGRGKEVAQYVKHGKETASVEVEIYRGNRGNMVVKRVITTHNTSQFYLQGEKASYKEVESCLKKLRIQLDNLCQFLPQDRVVEFAKMNNVQLLENTEKTVGGSNLYEQHMRVRSAGGDVRQLRSRLQDLTQEHDQELARNTSVEAEVHNHQVRQQLEEQIAGMQTRRLWFLYTQQRTRHMELKRDKERIQKEIVILKERWQPETDQIEKFHKKVEDTKSKIKREERVALSISTDSSSLESRWLECEEQRADALLEYSTAEQRHNVHEHAMADLRKQLAAIQAEVEQHAHTAGGKEQDDASLQKDINSLTGEVESIGAQLSKLQGTIHESSDQRANHIANVQQMQAQLGRLQDTTSRRMQLLQQKHRHAYDAAVWLKDNSHVFSDIVYPPICTLLNVPDSRFAQYVEDRIPRADLIAFVCRNKDDVNLLKKLMDQRGLPVNIVHTRGDTLDEFVAPWSLQEIQKLGFEQFLVSAVEGPGAVLNYLCRTHALHRIPVATHDRVNPEALPQGFSRYYIGDNRYNSSRSRYTGDVMTNMSQVNKPMLLTFTMQTQRVEALQDRLAMAQQELQAIEEELRGLREDEVELKRTMEEKRQAKAALLRSRNHRKTLATRLEQKQGQIERRENDVVDLTSASTRRDKRMQKTARDCVEVVKGCSELKQREVGAQLSLNVLRSQHTSIQHAATSLTAALAEVEEKLQQKQEEVAAAAERTREAVRAGQTTLTQLLTALKLKSSSLINDEVRSQFSEGVQGLESTEQKLAELEAHRDCLVTADDQVVAEYNARKQRLLQLSLQLEKLREEATSMQQGMETQRAEWLANVAALKSTISASFSQLMARMQCAGEVKLSKPDDEDDLRYYGLSIWVRFRGSERLRELTAQQQSGGERAVATALYLLALQTLSAVPFRAADEINQGMDPENERQMFTMLVDHMTEPNASQYFLVTPKLLPNLPYNERMNFICVFNGPKIYNSISVKDTLRRKAKLNKAKAGKGRA